MDNAHIADQILTAGTALAGLILVFLGMVFTAYDSYDAEQKDSVRHRYWLRGAFAFGGFIAALLAAMIAMAFYWVKQDSLISAGALVLGASAICIVTVAVLSLWDLR